MDKDKQLEILRQREQELLEEEYQVGQDIRETENLQADFASFQTGLGTFLQELEVQYQEPHYFFEQTRLDMADYSSDIIEICEDKLLAMEKRKKQIDDEFIKIAKERMRIRWKEDNDGD